MNKGDLKKTLNALELDFLPVAMIAHRTKFNYYKCLDALNGLKERGRATFEERPRGTYWKKLPKAGAAEVEEEVEVEA